jgi:1,4-dihydroxy-2-naphthoate octaprenyltransferase
MPSLRTGEPGALVWLRAARAPFLAASSASVLLGAFAAYWKTGLLDALNLAATLAGIACIHLGANLANDYFDETTGCDRVNPEPTPYSGGSRVIQEGLISARAIVAASAGFLLAGLVIGLYINSNVPGNSVLFIGLTGAAGGLLYTAVPVKLSYRGFGEAVVFSCFGPLLVAGSYLVQAGRLDLWIFPASVPAGLLVLAVLLVNEVLDVEWDRLGGKKTVVVLLGRGRGYRFYLGVYAAAYAWIGMGLLLDFYPPAALSALLPFFLSIRRLGPGRALRDRAATIEASRATILSQAASVVLLALAYLVHA